jgi:hypothetical protein
MIAQIYNIADTILDWVALLAYRVIFADEELGFYDD